MITPSQIKDLFYNKDPMDWQIIAQDDDNDYSESGWVAVVQGNEAAISAYSHCSCDGTWDSIDNWDWTGTIDEMLILATKKLDPNMPEKKANRQDYDYDHLMNVYAQILAWNENKTK